MLNLARFARWTAPLYAGLPVSITLGGADFLKTAYPYVIGDAGTAFVLKPMQLPLSISYAAPAQRLALRLHPALGSQSTAFGRRLTCRRINGCSPSRIQSAYGFVVASRSGRRKCYSLRIVRSVERVFGFAKHPNFLLNLARSARWTAPLYAGLPVSINVRRRAILWQM
jgi:hypothetical protein